jgi:hypothetical protein
VTTIYSNVLSSASPQFIRPSPSGYRYYQAIQITPSTTGLYTFVSNSAIDTYGYLYNYLFNPFCPSANMIAINDDINGDRQFRIAITLQITKCILVITTCGNGDTGIFSIKIFGPAFLRLTTANPITSE